MALEALPPLADPVSAGSILLLLSALYALGRVLAVLSTPRLETPVQRVEPLLSRTMPPPATPSDQAPTPLRALPEDSVTKF